MDMHEVEGCSWSGLHDKSDVGRNEVGSMDLVYEDSCWEVVSFGEEAVKGVSKLRGKNHCFPFGMVSSDIEMVHGVVETFTEVGVR